MNSHHLQLSAWGQGEERRAIQCTSFSGVLEISLCATMFIHQGQSATPKPTAQTAPSQKGCSPYGTSSAADSGPHSLSPFRSSTTYPECHDAFRMPPLAQQTLPAAPPAATSHQGCPPLSILAQHTLCYERPGSTHSVGTGGEGKRNQLEIFIPSSSEGCASPSPALSCSWVRCCSQLCAEATQHLLEAHLNFISWGSRAKTLNLEHFLRVSWPSSRHNSPLGKATLCLSFPPPSFAALCCQWSAWCIKARFTWWVLCVL